MGVKKAEFYADFKYVKKCQKSHGLKVIMKKLMNN